MLIEKVAVLIKGELIFVK